MAALTAALIATAGAAIYQAVEANQARQDAKGQANKQADAAAKATAEAKAASDQANATSTSDLLRDQAKARQAQIMGGAQGRGSTILTSPLGVTQSPPTANKTLLGM